MVGFVPDGAGGLAKLRLARREAVRWSMRGAWVIEVDRQMKFGRLHDRTSPAGTPRPGGELTRNKARGGLLALCPDEMRSNTKPLDLIWFVAVVTAFVIFAGTLYWADHRTRE